MAWLGKLFGGKGPTYEVADVYRGMRDRILGLVNEPPEGVNGDESGGVLAVLMDTSQADYGFSVAAVADGTLSLYLSNGGGTIGTGQWHRVSRMVKDFVERTPRFLEHGQPTTEFPLPPAGQVAIHFVTTKGVWSARHKEEDLGNNELPLSPVFHRAHDLVSTIRFVSELQEGEHALVFAAEMDEVEMARTELDSGADANMQSSQDTPVVAIATRNGNAELLKLLLDAGADANVRIASEPGEAPDTPLLGVAATLEEPECIELLLAAGAAIEAHEATGLTALHMASYLGHEVIVAALIERGADLECRESTGYTPLMMAANAGKTECVQALLEAGAEPNATDRDDSTPVMFAAQHGYAAIVELLLAKGADPTMRGTHGLDAIGFAQQNDHEAVEALLHS